MKKNSEDHIQIFLASFLKKLQLAGFDFIWWHTPNGGSRSAIEGNKFKMMGVLPGVPDICLMAKNKVHFVELKKMGGTVSKDQKEFIEKANGYNFQTSVIIAADPSDAIRQVAPILIDVFGFDQNGISKSSEIFISGLSKA